METTDPGGINKVVFEIAKNFVKKGHEVVVMQPNPSNLSEEEECHGFKIIRISSPMDNYFYGLSLAMYQYLKKYLKTLNPDIVHVHGYHTLQSLEVIHTLKRINPNIPVIFSPYLDIAASTIAGKYFSNIHNFFGKKAVKKCDYILSSSHFEAEKTLELFDIIPNHLSVIPLGVDLLDEKENLINKNISNDIVGINTSKNIKNGDNIKLLYTGYLISRKGVDLILNSLKYLVHDLNFKNVILTIIGEGPQKQKLVKLSKDLGLEDHILWKSFQSREDLIREIENADIFILLSRSEAYGITVAEALVLGTPCIITNRTALKEFSNEPGCFVVDYPPNTKDVANLILKVYKTDVTVGPFTKKIRSWNEVSDDYERLYQLQITK